MTSKEVNPDNISEFATKILSKRQPFLLPNNETILLTGEQRRVLTQLIRASKEGKDHVPNEELMARQIANGTSPNRADGVLLKTIYKINKAMGDTGYEVRNLTTPQMRNEGIKGGYAFGEKTTNTNNHQAETQAIFSSPDSPTSVGTEKRDLYVKPEEAREKDFVVFEDGTKLDGLKPYEKAMLEKAIEKSKNGEPMSIDEFKQIYLPFSGNPTVTDKYIRGIVLDLRKKVEESTDYTLARTGPVNKLRDYVLVRITQEENYKEKNPIGDKTDSPKSPIADGMRETKLKKEEAKRKRQPAEMVKEQMPVYFANDIVSAIAKGQLSKLNRSVHILLEKSLKQITFSNLTLADILAGAPIEQVKRDFITELHFQLERGFNSITDPESLSPEERELIDNCNKARRLGYDPSSIITYTRRHFDIPANIEPDIKS